MRISDWSSDVCSSDLRHGRRRHPVVAEFRVRRQRQIARQGQPIARGDRDGHPARQRSLREARPRDRKSVGWGKSVTVRVDLGGRRMNQRKNAKTRKSSIENQSGIQTDEPWITSTKKKTSE